MVCWNRKIFHFSSSYGCLYKTNKNIARLKFFKIKFREIHIKFFENQITQYPARLENQSFLGTCGYGIQRVSVSYHINICIRYGNMHTWRVAGAYPATLHLRYPHFRVLPSFLPCKILNFSRSIKRICDWVDLLKLMLVFPIVSQVVCQLGLIESKTLMHVIKSWSQMFIIVLKYQIVYQSQSSHFVVVVTSSLQLGSIS